MSPFYTWRYYLLFLLCVIATKGISQDFSLKKLDLRKLDSMVRMKEHRSFAGQKSTNPGIKGGSVNKYSPASILPSLARQSNTTNCHDTSGKYFFKKDSVSMYIGDTYKSKDGHFLLAGQYYNNYTFADYGFLMKCDDKGNIMWAQVYDSTNQVYYNFLYYYNILELIDGSIIMAGKVFNQSTGNQDLIITKTDNSGNVTWSKTYKSRLWTNGNGSSDYFYVMQLKQDPYTGDLYMTGPHWTDGRNVTKFNQADGSIIWSKYYQQPFEGFFDGPFGIDIQKDKIISVGKFLNYNAYISFYVIDKMTGDTIKTKFFEFPDTTWYTRGFLTYERLQVLANGDYALSGELFGYYQNSLTAVPNYHAGVVIIDSNLNFKNAYCFRNYIESNSYNTRVTMFPDGSGLFSMLHAYSGYTADAYYVQFQNGNIIKRRKKSYTNEGIPGEPQAVKTSDGGDMIIKLLGDSINSFSKTEFLKLHYSDTASMCIGINDNATFVESYSIIPRNGSVDLVGDNDFSENNRVTLSAKSVKVDYIPGCVQTSYCDSLSVKSSRDTLCSTIPLYITTRKNKQCGTMINWDYDSSLVQSFIQVNDTTVEILFKGNWQGTIYANIAGCSTLKDSVKVTVLNTPPFINLGPDSVLCPGNTLLLHAGGGFAKYLWQDGSSDSVFAVTKPGIYFVKATGACGDKFYDTVIVNPHAPIAFDAGPDRVKCNADTIHLNAPAGFLNYKWLPSYYLNANNLSSVIVSPLLDTAYTVIGEKTPGCFAYDTIKIRVNHSPAIDLGKDTSFCYGDSLTLNAGANFNSYKWNTGNFTQKVIAKLAGSYSVAATTIQGCTSFDTLLVTNVSAKPTIPLDHDSSLCSGASRLLTAGSFSSYQWNNGSTSPTITVQGTGTYAVKVTDGTGCTNSDTVIINTILPSPHSFLPPDTSICSYGNLQLKVTHLYSNYLWNNNSSAASITIFKPGKYWLEVTDQNKCTGRDSINVMEKQCLSGFYAPNAFTPNNDGINDLFKPLLFGNIDSYVLTIYNRFGEKVFESTDASKGWNGNYKGASQNINVFLWVCKYNFLGEAIKTERGTVVLIK